MLEKDPADRFDDMSDALRALGALPLLPGDPTYQELAALVETHHTETSIPTTPVSPLMRRTPEGVMVMAEADTTPMPSSIPTEPGEDPLASAPTADMTAPVKKGPTIVAGSAHRPRRRWRAAMLVTAIGVVTLGVGKQISRRAGVEASAALVAVIDPVASVTLPVDVSTMSVGETAKLVVAVVDSTGASLTDQQLAWTSSDPGVAKVDEDGEVQAAGIGTAFIRVSSGDHRDSTRVIVSAPAQAAPAPRGRVSVAQVVVAPSELSLIVGGSEHLAATARDGSGRTVKGRSARWKSADPAIAEVDDAGLVTALMEGATAIRVTVEGKTRTVPVTVNPEPAVATTLNVLTDEVSLEVGGGVSVSAAVIDQRGDPMELSVSWLSRDPGLVAVAADGVAQAISTGTTWLVASAASKTDSVRATVVVRAEQQFQMAVGDFLEAINAHDLASLQPLFQPADEDQQKRITKLADKVKNGSWDLQADNDASGLTSRVSGDRAIVDFTVELRWKISFGGRKKEKVTFIATFAREGARWRMTRVQTAAGTKL
jgi:uncharacterized protein YjdB